MLKNHFNPKPLVIAERYKFYQRRQETAVNVAEYLAALRKCAEHCNFADLLQQALRDRFVCGLNSSAIQKRLLAESELSLTRALEIAQSIKAAAKQAEYLSLGNPAAAAASDHVDVNFIKSKTHPNFGNRPRFARGQKNTDIVPGRIQQQRLCFRCGNKDHMPQMCRFKIQYCRVCKNKGHISTVCEKNIPAEQNGKIVDHTVGETISSDQVGETV